MVGYDTRSTGNWPGQRLSQFSLQTNLIVASSETLTGSQFMTSKSHVPWIIEPFNCTMVIYLPFVDSIAFSGYLVCKYTKRLGFKERSEQSLKLLGILLSILWKKEKNEKEIGDHFAFFDPPTLMWKTSPSVITWYKDGPLRVDLPATFMCLQLKPETKKVVHYFE